MTTILIKKRDTAGAPSAGDLTNAAGGTEIAVNTVTKRIYTKDAAGNVVELGTNPSALTTNLLFSPDATYDIGASGATRPRNLFLSGAATLGTALTVPNGGTGLTTLATGSLSYGAGTSAFSTLAIGTAGQILTVNSGATAPQWSTLSGVAVTTLSFGTTGLTPSTATSGAITVAGTLATTNGGTGLTSFTASGVVYASSTSALATGSALTFDGANLGIGTASPNAKLVVAGGSEYITNTAGNSAGIEIAGNGNTPTTNSLFIGQGSTSLAFIYQRANADMLFGINNTEQMRLTSTGLGIGTSSPGTALHVQRSSANAVFRLASSGGAGRDWNINSQTDGYLTIGSDLLAGQLNLYQGNLGLGITSIPTVGSTTVFAVGAANGGTLAITQSGSIVYRTSASTSGVDFFNPNASPMQWYTAGTSRIVLDASGNFVVGGTTALLNNAGRGNITLNGATDAILAFGNGGTNSAYIFSNASNFELNAIGARVMNFTVNGSERARIDSSGNLLVGTTSVTPTGNGISIQPLAGGSFSRVEIGHASGVSSGNPYMAFIYAGTTIGSITQSGTTAVLYNVTSDQRLKENIVDAPEFGSVIDSIKVRSYDWKTDQTHQRAGFIAQELVTVTPEAVHQPSDPEEMMAVDYSKLVPMLVKEIQSLRKRLAAAGIA
jgi:hypothetical protein